MTESTKESLPEFRSHKVVRAGKILKIERMPAPGGMIMAELTLDVPGKPAITVGEQYLRKHTPQEGGYYVRYPDGYESWSPAKAFESGYVRTSASE